jgi:hypothetical protein
MRHLNQEKGSARILAKRGEKHSTDSEMGVVAPLLGSEDRSYAHGQEEGGGGQEAVYGFKHAEAAQSLPQEELVDVLEPLSACEF